VGKGDKLANVGLGGLAHMAVKFGVAFGVEVTVIRRCLTFAPNIISFPTLNLSISKISIPLLKEWKREMCVTGL
jgi:hypothetical protein